MADSRKYLLSRIGSAALTVFLLASLTFFLLRLIPGGPFDQGDFMPAHTKKMLEAAYGLDRPLLEQYVKWLHDIAAGDLHFSLQYPELRVTEILAPAALVSLKIGGIALLLSLVLGIGLAVIGAWADWKKIESVGGAVQFLILCFLSLPAYLIGALLIVVFSFRLKWFPSAFLESEWSYFLPVFTLSLKPAALFARYLRASLLEVLGQDYIRTATAKGVGDIRIVAKHAMRNSLISLVAILGSVSAHLLTGSIVIETIFQLPGMGKYFVQSVLDRDYTLAIGTTLILGVILTLANLFADFLLVLIDPRIDLQSRKSP